LLILVPIAAGIASSSRWHIRIALWGVIATYILAIFLTFSRGGLIALFGVMALMGWKQRSFIIRVGMIAGLVGSLVIVGLFWQRKDGFNDIGKDTTFNQRIATIQAGGLMFEHNPLLGVGPGCSMVAYPLYVPKDAHCGCQDQLVIHNSFIQILSELGILGFAPFMLFLGFSLYHAWQMERGPIAMYGTALGVALWGFMLSSLSGGFAYTWWPYLLVGLIAAAKRISDTKAAQATV
jgi:putative inorganic carbon (hco3(-)) transporter